MPPSGFKEVLRVREIRLFLGSVGFFTFAGRALLVVIGFQTYRMTHSALALGWLGLIEAIPAISLVLFGGYAADRFNRKTILLLTRAASCLCGAGLVAHSLFQSPAVWVLYVMVFLVGVARGFSDPASTAFEAQIVPKVLTVSAASCISSVWIASSVAGPIVIGFLFDAGGPAASYGLITVCFVFSFLAMMRIPPKPQPLLAANEPMLKSIRLGWHFVLGNQPLFSALTLDLFAVLFGGTIALLPIYAQDILKVGAKGLGILNAAPNLGAMAMTLWATRHPPIARAGRNLLWAVAGFGVSILVFAFSKNFILSISALFLSGVFDGVSMVIRRSMVRLLSPDDLRGRIAAANWVFISASNELGAFESGLVAAWIGTIPCVAVGGVATLIIVGLVTLSAPKLRRLCFDIHSLDPSAPTP